MLIPGQESLEECISRVAWVLARTKEADRSSVCMALAQWLSNYATQVGTQASATRQSSATLPAVEGSVTVGPRNKR